MQGAWVEQLGTPFVVDMALLESEPTQNAGEDVEEPLNMLSSAEEAQRYQTLG